MSELQTIRRITFLMQPEISDKIMQYHSLPEFRRRSVAACMESVQVPQAEEF